MKPSLVVNLLTNKVMRVCFNIEYILTPKDFENYAIDVQWNLDLRKILGVTKIFLKSRFFLISNIGKSLIMIDNTQ